MNTTSNTPFRLAALLAITVMALSSACATPGRCVGVQTASLSANEKVLVNVNDQGVAIEGYDPVAYFTDQKAVKGNPEIRAAHGGAIYWFASTEHKALFEANPAKYKPEFGGWCAYAASIDALSPVDPNFWEIKEGRLLLQHNQRAWDLWHKDPDNNLVKADQNWPGLVERNGVPPRALLNIDESGVALMGYDPTSYFLDSKPRKGDPSLARQYQGATYYFVDKAHKDAFEKDPAKYAPKFGGFCGYAASIDKVSVVNPEIWQLVDGRLVLQHTDEAYRLFNEDVASSNEKAERYWPGLSHRACD